MCKTKDLKEKRKKENNRKDNNNKDDLLYVTKLGRGNVRPQRA